MKKYFIVSDIHSYYTEFTQALDSVGFDITDKDHVLIIAGDLFDRGDETKELYELIISIPKERRILIRGNHEYLLKSLLQKDFPELFDYSNRTVKTCCDFTGADFRLLDIYNFYSETVNPVEYWNEIRKDKNLNEIVEWMFSDEWVDYFELGNYIVVHSFIPLEAEYIPEWRTLESSRWKEAVWGCPWQLYQDGLFNEEANAGKTLICGHWHSSDFYKNLDGNDSREIEETCPIYYGKNIIAIDACTAYTKRCNVLVVNENGELL